MCRTAASFQVFAITSLNTLNDENEQVFLMLGWKSLQVVLISSQQTKFFPLRTFPYHKSFTS